MQSPDSDKPTAKEGKHLVLELTVPNHPGVMSHICGLFARRAFTMEGMLCLPAGTGEMSRIWIRIEQNGQTEQIVKQLRRLADVRTVRFHGAEHQVFARLEPYFAPN